MAGTDGKGAGSGKNSEPALSREEQVEASLAQLHRCIDTAMELRPEHSLRVSLARRLIEENAIHQMKVGTLEERERAARVLIKFYHPALMAQRENSAVFARKRRAKEAAAIGAASADPDEAMDTLDRIADGAHGLEEEEDDQQEESAPLP